MERKAVLFSTGLEGALSSFTSCCALCSCGGDGHPAVYASVSAAQSAFPKLVCIPPACPDGGALGFLSIHTRMQLLLPGFISCEETCHSVLISFKNHLCIQFKITICNNVCICFVSHLPG